MSDPTWTVLIPTLGQRGDKLRRLLDVLLPQLEPYGKRARVLALWNNGEYPVSVIRQTLLRATSTKYFNFVDDDDLVPEYYAREIMRALEYNPDYLGWPTRYYVDGRYSQTIDNSLTYGAWCTINNMLRRDISHTHTMRTSVGQLADFRYAMKGRAEDRVWVRQVRDSRLLKREVYIDRIMYHYYYSRSESDTWRQRNRIRRVYKRPVISHPNFEWYEGKMLPRSTHNERRRNGMYASRQS